MKEFWNKFYQKPLNEIPWQNTQADWFKELSDSGKISGKIALDLGCGTGMKSIYLAQQDKFEKIIGVDISARAIEVAKNNAQEADITNCEFIEHDVTDWAYLSDKKFDFILDWANLHGIPKDKRREYVEGIANHTHLDSLLLLRCFSSDTSDEYFIEKVDGEEGKIYLFKEEQIMSLFPDFEVLQKHRSLPQTKGDYFFIEFLMKRK